MPTFTIQQILISINLAMIQVLLLLVAFCHVSYAPPAHSSGSGVTECQDALLSWYNNMDNRASRLSCTEFTDDMVEILGSCRPSDTTYMLAILAAIYNKLDRSQVICAAGMTECSATMECLEPMFAEPISKTLTCHKTIKGFAAGQTQGKVFRCLEDEINNCTIAGILRHTTGSVARRVCSGSVCISPTGVYETITNSNCHKWVWILDDYARRHEFSAPEGAMFDTDKCNLYYDKRGRCYN